MKDQRTIIEGKARTVRELLKGMKYSIDYYQREYKWQGKQIRELIDDLSGKFLEEFQENHTRKQVSKYPHYFLGSIIISAKDGRNYIVDGQQRLTSLTLLLILLRHLQSERKDSVNIDELISSEKYGEQSFNMDVPERQHCLEALFEGDDLDSNGESESIKNIVDRYHDLEEAFPDELREKALPYFIDWLLENVHLVEITTYSDNDAYTIFETMNDRGLSLSSSEMLKGYLLANIDDEQNRNAANDRWRSIMLDLSEFGKDAGSDSIKAWLRSQYANKIRERKKGAIPEDFDRIGTEFHRWLRGANQQLGLADGDAFHKFISRDFRFYSEQYQRLLRASTQFVPGLEHVLYIAQHGFTLQYMLLLAPVNPDDSDEVCLRKQGLVARYLDILLAWRLWNFRSIAYSTMQYAMFLVMRDIRGMAAAELAEELYGKLRNEEENFVNTYHRPEIGLFLHQQNRYALHRLLARLTDYVETQSGKPSQYIEYIRDSGKNRFEIEHILADKYERYSSEYSHSSEFSEHRNRFGGLLLLPKKINASYGDLPYEEKLEHYITQNLLAASLHPKCYERNPGFTQFVQRSGLAFCAHNTFTRNDIDARWELYTQLAEHVWNPEDLLESSTP